MRMESKKTAYQTFVLLAIFIVSNTATWAQAAFDQIQADRYFAATNYRLYPDTITTPQTPPPAGKHPFYISHYGRHGSRYMGSRKAYLTPLHILQKGYKAQKLTQLGLDLRKLLANIIHDTHGHWGDLSALGHQQNRDIARRMMQNYPEVFEGDAHIQARSTTMSRCMLSMGSALQQLKSMNPRLQVDMDASHEDMWYLNFQDKQLRDSMMTPKAKKAFEKYSNSRKHNWRLMNLIFTDSTFVKQNIDDEWLNYYLLKTDHVQLNTKSYDQVRLADLFTMEDLYSFWQYENAWWYICYGPSPLNGGFQPYTQRHLLRQIIQDADSCLTLNKPGVQLRFGHDTMILPLVCLIGLNGYDFQTENLEEVEKHGWWVSDIIPMAANLQFVFYREHPQDQDVIFKILLNEKEATLPIPTDIAPYYHWRDFREFYLKKLDDYEAR